MIQLHAIDTPSTLIIAPHLPLRDVAEILKFRFPNSYYGFINSALSAELLTYQHYGIPIVIDQHMVR